MGKPGGGEDAEWVAGRVDETGTFRPGELSVSLEFTDTGEWWTEVEMDVLRDCLGECEADTIDLRLATAESLELDTVSVDVVMPDGVVSVGLAMVEVESDRGSQTSRLRLTLPDAVYAGEHFSLTLRQQKEVAALADSVYDCVAPSLRSDAPALYAGVLCAFEHGTGATTGTGLVLDAIPALPHDHDGLDLFEVETTVRLPLPIPYEAIAPGASTSTDTGTGREWTFERSLPLRRSEYHVLLFDSLGSPVSHASGSLTLQARQDLALGAAVSDYLDGGAGDGQIDDALSFLEGKLGAGPAADWDVILMRAHELGEPVGGMAFPGLSLVTVSDADPAALGEHWEADVLHELAHVWARAPSEGEARWVVEGTAVLLGLMASSDDEYTLDGDDLASHYHESGTWTFDATEVLHVAVETHADLQCAYGATNQGLEGVDTENFTTYYVGAYALSQAYFTARAKGVTASEFWTALSSRLQTAGGLDRAGVEAFLTDDLGLPYFYEQWVRQGVAYGTPLLAIDELSYWSGTLSVRQVQRQLFKLTTDPEKSCGDRGDFPTFYDVPYYLVCAQAEAAETRSFSECHVADGGVLDDTSTAPDLHNDSAVVTSLAVSEERLLTPLVSDPWPSWLWVAGNDALQPGQVPNAGRATSSAASLWWGGARRLMRCDSSYDAPHCAVDVDADGYRGFGDCNDADAAVHPLGIADVLDGTGTDHNCDSWYTKRPE